MCGRFTLTVDPAELKDAFADFKFPEKFAPRFNIAPTQPVLAIPNDGKNQTDFFMWGLIPSWAKDPAIGNRLINARGETLAEKPAFRGGYKYKRCLILANGFMNGNPSREQKPKRPISFISRAVMSLRLQGCGMNGILRMVQPSVPAPLLQRRRTI